MNHRLAVAEACLGLALCFLGSQAEAAPIDQLGALVPTDAAGFLTLDGQAFQAAARLVDDSAVANSSFGPEPAARRPNRNVPSPLAVVQGALETKRRVDELLDRVLALRTEIIAIDPQADDDGRRRAAARGFLRAATTLIDLSGRLRYLQNDVVRNARSRAADVGAREQLADLFLRYRSTVGATQCADDLFTFPGRTRYHEKLLRLIGTSGQTSLLPIVVRYVEDTTQPTAMRMFAAEVIRTMGLPQPPRPNPPEELPEPAIVPERLHELVASLSDGDLDTDGLARRQALLDWLEERRKRGIVGDSYRIGSYEVRPGDWLLMRNPSPYNLFTDLSPGLFTHVGMVAAETGADGVRRFVIVDVPERGERVPAVNVEIYLERTLHYFFLRDQDAKSAAQMAGAAADVIGNPAQFDLNFRSDRVYSLAKKPLKDVKIHTYCAGLLLLAALQTDVNRSEYFPLTERQAAGYTVENVAKMGLSLGEGFLSPSGALFSPRMEIVGRREPMYDPRREVEEAVYDYFASALVVKQMTPEGNWYQALRQRVAEASTTNPLLAKALATAAGVGADTDLAAAAKAAAIVETLDETAVAAGENFQAARDAVRNNAAPAATNEEAQHRAAARRRHADLIAAQQSGRMAPRDVRLALVRYYIAVGRADIDRKFFQSPAAGTSGR
ncbi:MAG: hypothetical protein K8U03_01600 [Planctomycetia bacterium]|nr:hypothetical protein [Planctomycetia bacterium]